MHEWRLDESAHPVQEHESKEYNVGVVGVPEAFVRVPAGVLDCEYVDGKHVDGGEDPGESSQRVPTPVGEVGDLVSPGLTQTTRNINMQMTSCS